MVSLNTFGAPFKLKIPENEIHATQPLDFESTSSYQIEVTVKDDGVPSLSSSINITITVNLFFMNIFQTKLFL